MHYNFIKQTNKRYLEELNNRWHEFPTVSQAVNTMQKTEWVINKPVLDVLSKCVDNSWDLGKIPINPEDIPFPPKPFDIAINEDARKQYKRKKAKVHRERAKAKSKFIQIKQIIQEAQFFLDKGFYFPYQLDFRGRIYPKATLLSPQGADYARALIKFKMGKPMGSNEAFDNFAIAGAGLYGDTDKEEIQIRKDWVVANADKILACANNPLEETWWSEADKPYSFLAWCFEYRDFANTGFDADFVATLPIHSDCSNSGLQHYSAMIKDEIGGKATNLVPANKPSDVYALVAEEVKKLLIADTDPLADLWLNYGIDRKICKKPVMCVPYSLTQYSLRQYVQDHVEKELNENNKKHPFGEDLFKPTYYLTKKIWSAIEKVIVGARDTMKFLKDVATLVASENLPIVWTTPLGLPIFMSTYKKQSKRVKTQMGDNIIKLSLTSDTDEINSAKMKQSVCPNLIHSLDASVLQLSVVKASKYGVDTFSLVHDSFGVLAPDVDYMSLSLREAFCEIYSQDVLANWAMEMKRMLSEKNQKKFPSLPAKGNLDVESVKNSIFFCV